VPSSEMIESILEVLKKEKFINDFSVVKDGARKNVVINLKYENGEPVISDVKRISRTSKRIYRGKNYIQPVRRGYGASVVTTPLGVISGAEAKKKGVGGEVLFEIW